MSRTSGLPSRNGPCMRRALAGAIGLALLLELVWEAGQLPWYAGWISTPWPRLVLYIGLGTTGDLLTLASAYVVTAVLCRDRCFFRRNARGWIVFTLLGLAYTVASEYVNVYVWHRWTYSPAMPTLPLIGTGLSPFLQWLLIPPAWLALLRRRDGRSHAPPAL